MREIGRIISPMAMAVRLSVMEIHMKESLKMG